MRIAGFKDRREAGASLTEYALVVALIAIISITGIASFGKLVQSEFGEINYALSNAGSAAEAGSAGAGAGGSGGGGAGAAP